MWWTFTLNFPKLLDVCYVSYNMGYFAYFKFIYILAVTHGVNGIEHFKP